MTNSSDICGEVMRIMPDSECYWSGTAAYEDTLQFRLISSRKTISITHHCGYYGQSGSLYKSVKYYLLDVLAACKRKDYK